MEQRRSIDDTLLGAVHYDIYKDYVEDLTADAGEDQEVTEQQLHSLRASNATSNPLDSISYQWYNDQDSLTSNTKTFNFKAAKTEKYILKVKSSLYGLVDYDTVLVKVKKKWLKSINPNPVTNNLNIKFKLPSNYSSATIEIRSALNRNNYKVYSLNPSQTSTNAINSINIAMNNYKNGSYVISLKVNGKKLESTKIIKK